MASLMATLPSLLMVHPSLPVKNVKELVALAKAKPGSLNYGSYGIGTYAHLSMEDFKQRTGTDIVHVPYNNVGNATGDLITNQVQFMFHLITGAQGAVKSVHGDWQIRCDTPPGAQAEQCALIQSVVAEDRSNAGLTVIVLKTADQKSKLMRVVAPLGVLLPSGLGLKLDNVDVGGIREPISSPIIEPTR